MSGPVKAAAVHRILRSAWDETMFQHGYTLHSPRTARWAKWRPGASYFVVAVRVDPGPDPFAGGSFTVHFWTDDLPDDVECGSILGFPALLGADGLEAFTIRQNEIVASFPNPTDDHIRLQQRPSQTFAEAMTAYHVAYPVRWDTPYTASENPRARYFSEEDVKRWAAFLLPYLPDMLTAFEAINGS